MPGAKRRAIWAIYVWCRRTDELMDSPQAQDLPVAELAGRLDRWEARTRSLFEGVVTDGLDRVMVDTLERYPQPIQPYLDMIEGQRMDLNRHRYASFEDLQLYCYRVAGTVGLAMAWLMGARTPATLARALDLGIGMQFTNIARDVGEDARNGRLYLPRQWLREADVDPDAFLASPVFSAGVASVTARLLAEADRLYARAEAGIPMLPRDCRPAIRAAHNIYAEIGAEVVRAGYDSVSRRAVVSSKRKLALRARAWLPAMPRRAVAPEPPLAANAYLVQAVPATELAISEQSLGERIGWAIELFAQLEERQRMAQQQPQR
jgi:phytoene synthase